MKPYLQGFFLSENVWRPDRDPQGYKVPLVQMDEDNLDADEVEDLAEILAAFGGDEVAQEAALAEYAGDIDPQAPMVVMGVSQLGHDVAALLCFFKGETPVQVVERPVSGASCMVYGGGDASGEGFGTLTTPLGMPPLL